MLNLSYLLLSSKDSGDHNGGKPSACYESTIPLSFVQGRDESRPYAKILRTPFGNYVVLC